MVWEFRLLAGDEADRKGGRWRTKVDAAEVQRFDRYCDRALVAPVTVAKHGRPSVVILSAAEYERLKKLDRQVLALGEISERNIAAIKAVRIPKRRRYRSSDLR